MVTSSRISTENVTPRSAVPPLGVMVPRTIELTYMFSKHAARGWRQTVVNLGWAAAAGAAADRLRFKLRRATSKTSSAAPEVEWQSNELHPFDREHGVDTSGLIFGEHLSSGSRNDVWNTAYYGIAPSIFRAAVGQIPPALRAGATFIDIGSGKGRAVMLASQYPFAKVVGVEIAPDLHRIAAENVAKYTKNGTSSAPVELLLQDATEYAFPAGPLVLYLYHPFCKPVLERVLRNLETSLSVNPRDAAVIYINLELRDVLDRADFLERAWGAMVEMDASDRLADRIGSSAEEYAIYRFKRR